MKSRYQELYRIPTELYIEGSPVIIAAGALQKDTKTNRVLAQIKIRNITDRVITSCKVSIKAFEPSGAETEGVPEHYYLDLNVAQGQDFGSKVPVYLPNNITRKFSVSVTEIVFARGTVWTSEPLEWRQIPKQELIYDRLTDFELQKQYELEVGKDSTFVPEIRCGLFQCTCGTPNLSTAASCYKCGRVYNKLTKKLDIDYLTAQKDIRIKKETEEREAAELKAKELRIAEEKAKAQAAEEARLKAEKLKRIFIKIVAVVSACVVIGLLLIKVIIPAVKYNKAQELFDSGNYAEAAASFEELSYKDSEEKALESRYMQATELHNSGKYAEAAASFEELSYKDSEEKALESRYMQATELHNSGKYAEAADLFEKLSYKDSKEKASESFFLYQKQKFSNIKVGSTIKFGTYEQDNDLSNGKEEIEWNVIAVNGNKALIISKYGLDCQQYNTTTEDITWEKCTLRTWLNKTFLNEAFSPNHQNIIVETSVEAHVEKLFSDDDIDQGNDTIDKVFLLSVVEAKKYFSSKDSLRCILTEYANAKKGLKLYGKGYWWLRSVSTSGYVCYGDGIYNSISRFGEPAVKLAYIRPALWIKLDS